MSDEDDDLLLATSFTFRNKQRLSMCPSDDEDSKPKLGFADILGIDADKEAMMASEDFWDRIAKPTQEEQLLKVEQEERLRQDEESEDEEEQSDLYLCLVIQSDQGTTFDTASDDEEDGEANVPVFKQIKMHLGYPDAQPIIPLLSSSMFPDLIRIANLPLDTRRSIFASTIDRVLGAKGTNLPCLENCAVGLVKTADFDFEYTEDRLRQWLMRLGISTKVDQVSEQTAADPLGGILFCHGANLQALLKVLLADLKGNIGRFQHQDVPSTMFRIILPMLFDPRLEVARPEVEELLQCCVEWVPVCLAEKVAGWFEPLRGFVLSPVSRLITVLRILSCTQKASLCVLPVLDHFMHDQLEEENTEMDSDCIFVRRVVGFCDNFTKDDNGCLTRLAQFLELAYLRLAGTSIEDMNLDDLAGLKGSLQTTKNSIPLQPSIRNLRCISLLSRMLIFLETSLRSRGFGLHKLHSTSSNI